MVFPLNTSTAKPSSQHHLPLLTYRPTTFLNCSTSLPNWASGHDRLLSYLFLKGSTFEVLQESLGFDWATLSRIRHAFSPKAFPFLFWALQRLEEAIFNDVDCNKELSSVLFQKVGMQTGLYYIFLSGKILIFFNWSFLTPFIFLAH